MSNLFTSKEFEGKFMFSYKDGEIIYAYDIITHGLFKFSFDTGEVTIVLSPQNIHQNAIDNIVGISKCENEIILIPSALNSEWIFFDVRKETIRYDNPIKDEIRISSAITIGEKLFLIPSDIYNPIVLFSLDRMKLIKIYKHWYKKSDNKTSKGIYIWGASSYDCFVVFPIVDSNQIGYISFENAQVITLDIPYPIFSVSLYKNRIWILPVSGEYIYMANLNGKVINRVSLTQIEPHNLASKFVRIIAIGEDVFLLPIYGEHIYVYRCNEKKMIQIKIEKKHFWRMLFVENAVPYWDFIIENQTLHLLPHDYHYKRIHLSSLKSEKCSLHYGAHLNYEKYSKMIRYIQKDCLAEKRESDLKDFFQYLLSSSEKHSTKENEKAGTEIWDSIIGVRL